MSTVISSPKPLLSYRSMEDKSLGLKCKENGVRAPIQPDYAPRRVSVLSYKIDLLYFSAVFALLVLILVSLSVPHWTRECLLKKESAEKPSCENCGLNHTTNYRECPKAPKVVPKKTYRTNQSHVRNAKLPPVKNAVNFPYLRRNENSKGYRRWGRKQTPRAKPELPQEANRRGPHGPAAAHLIPDTAASFTADIQTMMSVLCLIKSSELSEFARDLRGDIFGGFQPHTIRAHGRTGILIYFLPPPRRKSEKNESVAVVLRPSHIKLNYYNKAVVIA
ncbi:hypothetical protein EVAR_9620_1 [Eumeta japonica]|uniref:Uncharacterized protein n=1 Tax=Eumeta variegata TaxID=151549 RepID=A0A4C1TKU4_EUMVA|nr:hypothetical protein EVAR_9620_1 [Eumeta japonica]